MRAYYGLTSLYQEEKHQDRALPRPGVHQEIELQVVASRQLVGDCGKCKIASLIAYSGTHPNSLDAGRKERLHTHGVCPPLDIVLLRLTSLK